MSFMHMMLCFLSIVYTKLYLFLFSAILSVYCEILVNLKFQVTEQLILFTLC